MFIIIPVNTIQDPEWGTDREKAPTVHLALTLQLQGQSISSSLIHSLNTENGEKK